MLKRMRIKNKLLFTFLGLAFLTAITGGMGIYFTTQVGKSGKHLGKELAPLGDAVMEIQLTATKAHLVFEEIMSGDSTENIDEVWELLDETVWYSNAIFEGGTNEEGVFIPSKDQAVRDKITQVKERVEVFKETAKARFQKSKNIASPDTETGEFSDEQMAGLNSSDVRFDEEFDKFMTLANEAETLIHEDISRDLEKLEDTTASSRNFMLIFSLFAVAIAFIFAFLLTRDVVHNLGGEIYEVGKIANQLARGDLNIEFKKGNNIGLYHDMEEMVNKLKEIISTIVTGAESIASASNQMSSSSQQLSEGANEQASAIEEVASSMEEMASNIQQNSDNSKQTEEISNKAATGIETLSKSTRESLNSVREIIEKINIINDIAFQTNILALNAAVEAARAGEHGRGFAVVAAEVRKLAEKSKVAADEIVTLSSSSRLVTENTGKIMEGLIPEIKKTSSLVKEITASSMEQNSGADQVNSSIQQMNSVTQQNAAAAEEMASSAEELSGQALRLKEVISFFKFDAVEKKQLLNEKSDKMGFQNFSFHEPNESKTSEKGKLNVKKEKFPDLAGFNLNIEKTAGQEGYESF